ncbi:HTH-type transcriptional regulator MurR [bioreactor metagenome]|jgi:DNA-binding MurR/RpiR family transcriptional regulator|uniref:HTH-type transcriptional regulator MurR n=2 Tax=root TaxID=1 RepID=A0A644VZR2_9ZZZZ|nr:MurR/RpiR family transcriptional regulator [Aminivibrio sp.]MDD3514385.1 MurR/RpiR family transcriptional regulator [Synergistaceae bacterium]NCB14874.1 MurR/RpiR family transcriptional regulator [Synergistales bacterium]MEA4951750.1 MurR/RpiR family transcriptional regulator [Aminivibrio sp.]HPF84211.1 MurR/RpiR family transcriptional regulator [Aminivibrio sp.]HPK06827.1 MurR/RpiR family transcriptional regulator [Aminivibrio sp.]
MDSAQLQAMLREKMEQMPNKARRVVEYLLSNTREAAFLSIGEVAEKLDVSKAQLVRVSRMVGFDGYADLKDALQNTVLEHVNPTALLSKIMKNRQDLPEEILRMEHANLDDTWNQLKPQNIVKFCEMVRQANMVYCMGWGISSIVAESLYTRLMEMGIRSSLMKRGSVALIEQARTVTKGDIVVVCELPSYVIEVMESIEKIAANGATVITITDSPAAPVCQLSDLTFFVSDTSPTFGSTIVGPVFLVHILTSVLCVNLGEKVRAALQDQEMGLHDERIYYPAYGLRY